MSRTDESKGMSETSSVGEAGYDFEWLHHAFTLEKRTGCEALGTTRANGNRRGIAVVNVGGAEYVTVDFRRFYEADPMEQVSIVKRGVNARMLDVLAASMRMPKEKLVITLGLARATIQRKSRLQAALSSDESSRVIGVTKLIGQAQAMVEESGAPEDFDAAVWIAHWLDQPLPALNGRRPGDLMDTAEGRAMVSQLLERSRSGAYA